MIGPNPARERLRAGEVVHGCFLRYPDAALTELLGLQGFDVLVLDGEHGTLEPRDCEAMVRAAELRGVVPIVRVPENRPAAILRLLDTGALGCHVPWVSSGEEAAAAVAAVKYQPEGRRGLAGVRAAGYGQEGPLRDYVRRANAATLVVVHVETAAAVERAGEIAAVAGVDVVFVGPTDLSHSLGVPGEPGHPRVRAAIDRVVEAVAGSDAALGIMVGGGEAAREWVERGARYVTVGFESLLGAGARGYLAAARGEAAS